MQIKYSPTVDDRYTATYSFKGDRITATINDQTDVFDFTGLHDGRLENPHENITTSLPINPIVTAERKAGVLYVQLTKFIGEDATEADRFPTWKEV